MSIKPKWLAETEKHIGLKEIPGLAHESRILNMWQTIKMGGIKDDETPWCAAFVGACLEASSIRSTRSGWAKSYLNWGRPLLRPALGCVVVFDRAGGGGHVGFATGYDANGKLLILGGNQGNSVNIKPFDVARILAYRWPNNELFPLVALATFDNNEAVSTNEG